MPLEDTVTPASGGKGSTKPSSNYTPQEDMQLCMSWESISMDPIVANEQQGKAYWKRIAKHFHANRTFHSDKNINSLEHRRDTITKECGKFQAFYEQVERRHQSGVPYKEHLLEAHAMFTTMPPKKAFQFIHCWLKVRNCPKFQEIDKSHKRPRPSKSSTLSKKSTKEEEEGYENGKSHTPDSAQASETKRPIGRKEAKQRLKTGGDAGPYNEAIEELILDKKEQKKLREEEKKLKEERWKEKRMIHHQKISLEKEKFTWEQEQRIMFCDVSTLNLDQKTYVLAMRAQNAAQKMAAFNSGFGSRFDGGFESSKGGDVNGASQ